jgi:hypothetical protein
MPPKVPEIVKAPPALVTSPDAEPGTLAAMPAATAASVTHTTARLRDRGTTRRRPTPTRESERLIIAHTLPRKTAGYR